ncbi:MAG TPA: translocation/assembly module TamB domain-containing protein [Usitatibacter sp.]|nr:translocation/assembly module TamB domain-containing protein [Usitatibacter sp.]
MSAQAPAAPPAPPPPRRRLRWLWWSLAIVAAIVLLAIAAIAWVFTTPEGARLVLGRVSGMLGEGTRFSDVEGRIGGRLRIGTIEVSRPDLYVRVEGFEIDTSPPLHGTLLVHRLDARSVQVHTASTGEAAKIPVTFRPPYPVKVEEARVGELRIGALTSEARAEKDTARRRALVNASRDRDFVVNDILVRGEGGATHWKIDEASARTSYGRTRIAGTLETASPFRLDANAQADGRLGGRDYRTAMHMKGTLKEIAADLEGEVSGQKATAHAAIEPFSKPPVRALEVRAQDVDASRFANAPRTRLAVDAQLKAEGESAFAGPVRIENAEPGSWDQQRLPFKSASGRVVVTAERIDVGDLSVALPGGGGASGRAVLKRSGVEADLRVADVDLAALHRQLQKTRMTGRVSVAGTSEAQRFEASLKDPRFDVAGRGALGGGRLQLETVRVKTGGGAVEGKGEMQLAGRREFRFEGRAEHFDPSAFVRTTAGDLNFRFVSHGTLANGPAGEFSADVAPSRYAGLPASGRIRVAGDAARLASSDVHILLGDGRLDASGSFGGPRDALDVTLHAPNLSAFAALAGIPMSGRLDAQARLRGTLRSPAGRVNLTASNLALPANVHVRDLALRAEAGVEPDSPIDATLQAKGVAVGKDQPPQTLAEAATVTVRGTRVAHRLELDASMTRESSVKAVLQGGLDPRAKSPAWNGRVESLALAGPGAFALQSPATLQVSAARIELGDAMLRGDWGQAHLAVTRWTPETIDLKGSSPALQVRNLARSLRLGDVPRSSLVVAADWNVHAAEYFDGTVNLRRVSGDLRVGQPPLPLGLSDLDVRLESSRGRASATVRVTGERVGRLEGEGRGFLERGPKGWQFARSQPVEARVAADVPDLSAFAAWLGPDAQIHGRMNANFTVSGTGASPRIAGQARAENLAMREPQSGFEMEQGQVALRLDGRSVVVDRLEAATPWHPSPGAVRKLAGVARPQAGRITAEGAIDLEAHTGALRVHATQVPVTQISTRFLAVTGEGRLAATADGLLATGAFKADAGWIGALSSSLPTVSEDVVVVRKAAPAPAPAKAREKEAVNLDMRFDLGDHLFFEGRGIDTRLVGDLRVTGAPTALRAVGAIRTTGGTYDAYGQKLAIERGALAFNGPVENPQLNVRAVRKGLPVEAGVEVGGTVAHPKVRLVSSPDVPEPEKLSWMVLGRGPSDLGPGDASVLVSAAASMFGKGVPGGDFAQRLGLDEVKIGRTDTQSVLGVLPQSTVAGRTGSASAAEVVTVGKKLTRNVHLSYEQGLADAEGALKVTLEISRQFQLLVRAGYLPGLDAVYRWTFD